MGACPVKRRKPGRGRLPQSESLNRPRRAADNPGNAKDLVLGRGSRTSWRASAFPHGPGDRMTVTPNPVRRELTPEAQAAAGWLRALARTIKLSRLYQGDNPLVVKSRTQVTESLQKIVAMEDLELR